MEINEIDIILFDTHLVNIWYIPKTSQYQYDMSNPRHRKCLLNKIFLPNLKIKYLHYCPFVKRNHRSHVKSHHKGPVIRKGFKFISPTCYVSYLNNLYIYIYYVCCCVVRTVTWLPMWSKMADVYLDGTPSRMSWTKPSCPWLYMCNGEYSHYIFISRLIVSPLCCLIRPDWKEVPCICSEM